VIAGAHTPLFAGGFGVLTALLALGAGCGAQHHRTATHGTKRLTSPQIREGFTRLPCPRRPRTTIAIEGCLEAKLLRTDAAIDGEAETVFSLLGSNGRRAFVKGERAWLAYRRAVCTADSSRYEGGTAEPVAFAACEVKENLHHLDDLAAIEGRLRSR
jgi:uncharacterized protein YecT (DUF1311 family)